jgi:hypothetical protein
MEDIEKVWPIERNPTWWKDITAEDLIHAVDYLLLSPRLMAEGTREEVGSGVKYTFSCFGDPAGTLSIMPQVGRVSAKWIRTKVGDKPVPPAETGIEVHISRLGVLTEFVRKNRGRFNLVWTNICLYMEEHVPAELTLRDLIEDDNQVPLGAIYHWAAKSTLSDAPEWLAIAVMATGARNCSTGDLRAYIEEKLAMQPNPEDRREFARVLAQTFAEDFLGKFPTRSVAIETFGQRLHLRSLLDRNYFEKQEKVGQILDLPFEDAETLLAALPLLKDTQARLAQVLPPAAAIGEPEGHKASEAEAPQEAEATHRDSGHYKYGPEDRRRIVEEYRKVRREGRALNKQAWAHSKYDISGKTLLSYEREFPEEE